MDISEVMRQTAATRHYEARDVENEVLYRVLDNARFAPSGGNRQGWRVVVVKNPDTRKAISDLYQDPWKDYVAKRYGPLENLSPEFRAKVIESNNFAAQIFSIPVHLAIWIDMSVVEVTDINAGRPSVVGGGSIFPFVQNFQLAARNEGLGTRITTLLSHREKDIQELLGVPDGFALAAMVMVGWPTKLVTKLKRNPVEDFTFIEKFGQSIEAPNP